LERQENEILESLFYFFNFLYFLYIKKKEEKIFEKKINKKFHQVFFNELWAYNLYFLSFSRAQKLNAKKFNVKISSEI